MDDEVTVDGGTIAFEARIYDRRLCVFLSVEPKISEFLWQSPYISAGQLSRAKQNTKDS